MTRKLLVLVVVVAAMLIAVDAVYRQQQPVSQSQQAAAPSPVPESRALSPDGLQPDRVADISVHTERDLELLFDRVEQLLDRPRSGSEAPLFTLVLHGPEVEFFALKNYERYKRVVDRTAKLAALGAVDVSICQTQMRQFGIGPDEVPSFLRQVPFGPGEVERLIEKGYVYM
jgi:intracellular sulfur oxidation DsrE/DsrF family protein